MTRARAWLDRAATALIVAGFDLAARLINREPRRPPR